MPIQAVIFDHDGVLADLDLRTAAVILGKLLPINMKELIRRWEAWVETVEDTSGTTLWTRWWNHLGDDLKLDPKIREQLHRFNYLDLFHEFADVKPMLAELRRRGLRVGILSNTPLFDLKEPLGKLDLLGLVDVICNPQSIKAVKPTRLAYQRAMEALSVTPEQCLFFDDEEPNVKGARDAGIRSFFVDRSRPAHAIEQSIVRDLSVVPQILDSIKS